MIREIKSAKMSEMSEQALTSVTKIQNNFVRMRLTPVPYFICEARSWEARCKPRSRLRLSWCRPSVSFSLLYAFTHVFLEPFSFKTQAGTQQESQFRGGTLHEFVTREMSWPSSQLQLVMENKQIQITNWDTVPFHFVLESFRWDDL